jgi:hypothetical protein
MFQLNLCSQSITCSARGKCSSFRDIVLPPLASTQPPPPPILCNDYQPLLRGELSGHIMAVTARRSRHFGTKSHGNTSYPCKRPWRPIGLWDVEDPILCSQSAHRWRLGCQFYAPAHLYTQKDILVLISVKRLSKPQGLVRLERLGKLKNSMTSSRLKPATFRLVAYRLNQLRYRIPRERGNTSLFEYITVLRSKCRITDGGGRGWRIGGRTICHWWSLCIQFVDRLRSTPLSLVQCI